MGLQPQLSPLSRHLIVWFPNYAWLTTSAVTPFIYAQKLKHERVEPQQRKILVAQETCRQIVSGGLGFLTSTLGILLGSKLCRGSGDKTLQKIIWSTLASCVSYAVIRPILGTDLFIRWMQHKGIMAFGDPSQRPEKAVMTATPEERIQTYFQGVQARAMLKFSGWA
jgi:hypothetical protein